MSKNTNLGTQTIIFYEPNNNILERIPHKGTCDKDLRWAANYCSRGSDALIM